MARSRLGKDIISAQLCSDSAFQKGRAEQRLRNNVPTNIILHGNNPGTSPKITVAIPLGHHQNLGRGNVIRERHYPVHRLTESDATVRHHFCTDSTFPPSRN